MQLHEETEEEIQSQCMISGHILKPGKHPNEKQKCSTVYCDIQEKFVTKNVTSSGNVYNLL
jgi:hypothetical protein